LSLYWPYYEEAYDKVKRTPVVLCKFCCHKFQHPRASVKQGAPTSTLKAHIEQGCKRIPKVHNAVKGAPGTLPSLFSARKEITQEDINHQILRFFMSGNIPFKQADNPEFQKLIAMIKINGCAAKAPCRKTVRRRLRDRAALATNELKETFRTIREGNGRISLALDCWTTRNMIPFLGKIHNCNVQRAFFDSTTRVCTLHFPNID
jgi:hypothetical protein